MSGLSWLATATDFWHVKRINVNVNVNVGDVPMKVLCAQLQDKPHRKPEKEGGVFNGSSINDEINIFLVECLGTQRMDLLLVNECVGQEMRSHVCCARLRLTSHQQTQPKSSLLR